jgi:hypothetical protein
MMKLRRRRETFTDDGYPDYFDDRHKRKMLKLAEIKPFDVFYDLGCGDASILILAAKESNVRTGIGYESNVYRARNAQSRVKKANLADRISIFCKDMYEADLSDADVIFAMHHEYPEDLKKQYGVGIRKGTRLIKHDLPIVGYLPDKVDYPFYRMTFPLKRAKSKTEWATAVLGFNQASAANVWYELYHYQFTKGYDENQISEFKRMLSRRVNK